MFRRSWEVALDTLIIIDMQPYFLDGIPHKRVEPLITNVQRELRKAISLRQWVFLLEYQDCGETDPRIIGCLKHYSRLICRSKEDDCGAGEVFDELHHQRSYPDLRVMGINSGACVLKTVQALSYRFHNQHRTSIIRVVADACEDSMGRKWHQDALSKMRKLSNVEVV
jgi:nicotinamidase-related amidase